MSKRRRQNLRSSGGDVSKGRNKKAKAENEGAISLEGQITDDRNEATFEFSDIKDDHVEGLTVLLRTMFANPTQAYRAACAIVLEVSVGTTITCEGETNTFALDLIACPHSTKVSECILGNIWDEMVSALAEFPAGTEWLQGNKDTTGMLLYRKFSNLPLELVAPLHASLIEDLDWAREVGNEIESKAFYVGMTHVALFSTSSSFQSKCEPIDVTGSSSVLFDYFEDEIYHQRSSLSFVFWSKLLSRCFVVILIPIPRLQQCVADITALLSKV